MISSRRDTSRLLSEFSENDLFFSAALFLIAIRSVEVEDWIMADVEEIANALVKASGDDRMPVAMVFEKRSDFAEYRSPDVSTELQSDGTYRRQVNSYTDEAYLKSVLAELGYAPVSVRYGVLPKGRKMVAIFRFTSERNRKVRR